MRRILRHAARRVARHRPPARLEAAVLIVILLVVSAAVLWDARSRDAEDVRATATNLVALLHEQTTTVFHMTDFVLRAATLRLHRETIVQDDPEIRAELTPMRASLNSFRHLFVIGPDRLTQP